MAQDVELRGQGQKLGGPEKIMRPKEMIGQGLRSTQRLA